MRLHRFCSQREFDAFMRGETLNNYTDHGAIRGYDVSTSVGFCFFNDDPDIAVHRLAGIVDLDRCITVEVPEWAIRICSGRYTNWVRPGISDGTVKLTEFCTMYYSRENFKLIEWTDKYKDYAPNASILRELFPRIFI